MLSGLDINFAFTDGFQITDFSLDLNIRQTSVQFCDGIDFTPVDVFERDMVEHILITLHLKFLIEHGSFLFTDTG